MSNSEQNAAVGAAVQPFVDEPGGLLPALWAVQNALGYVPAEQLPNIAEALNLSVAEVHGVLSFYHDFKTAPPAAHTVKLCRAEACQAMGARNLAERLEQRFKTQFDQGAGDADVALESVYCLGLCSCAPAAMIDGKLHARLDRDSLDQQLQLLDAGGDS